MTIGEQLRAVRKQRRYTLREVGEKAGYTASLISQIERNLVDPPVSTLERISSALDIPLFALLNEEAFKEIFDEDAVTRKDQGVLIGAGEFDATYSLLNPYKQRKMDVVLMEAEVGGSSGPEYRTHLGEECEFVIQGVFEVEWDGKTFTLHEGDTIYIDSSKPHRWRNAGSKKLRVLSVLMPSKI